MCRRNFIALVFGPKFLLLLMSKALINRNKQGVFFA